MSQQNNDLFVANGDLSDVVLNWYGQAIEKLEPYAKAYHSAARDLVEKSTDNQLRDIGACPVVFLYRLAAELYLKAILISGSSILQLQGATYKTVEEILNRGHNLSGLLDDFRGLYRVLDWKWDERNKKVAKRLREFERVDPGSFCFRYPVTKSGDSALEQDFRFNLQNFCLRMDEVLGCLDEIDCGLAGTLDQVQEAALNGY